MNEVCVGSDAVNFTLSTISVITLIVVVMCILVVLPYPNRNGGE